MSLSDLASLGSFVSGFAVLISLIYLALQVRQAEKNQRALIQQGRAARSAEHLERLADPEMVSASNKVRSGDPGITYAELRSWEYMFRAGLYNFEDAYFQHERGLLDDASFQSVLSLRRSVFTIPGYRVAWKRTRDLQEETFRHFVDGILGEVRAAPLIDESALVAAWHKDIAAELTAADPASRSP